MGGVGDVLTGRVEQGVVKPNDEVLFLPTHSASTPCTGKVFTVEMHHKSVPSASTGDNVGLNVKNLPKENMPRVGDVMVLKSDTTIPCCLLHSSSTNPEPSWRAQSWIYPHCL